MSGLDHLDYDDVVFLAEVHRMVSKAVALAGSAPAAGSPAWWAADSMSRLAGLLVLAERYLVEDPHAIAAQMIKDLPAEAISSECWLASSALPSHQELVRRRAKLVTPVRCGYSGCRTVLSVEHPLPNLDTVRCTRHPLDSAKQAAA